MPELSHLVGLFEQALLSVDEEESRRILALAGNGLSSLEIVDGLIVPTLERIGVKWERGEVALSQVYMCGRICEALAPKISPPGGAGRIRQPVIAMVVLDDYHFLGKTMVLSALRACGFDPLDWGRADTEEVVRRVQAERVDVLMISTLMLPSALKVKAVRQKLEALGRRVIIVVGGAPFRFDPQLWRDVGADACGNNALEATEIVRRLTRDLLLERSTP
jgi:methanogenic corrinoid protein MtbC1